MQGGLCFLYQTSSSSPTSDRTAPRPVVIPPEAARCGGPVSALHMTSKKSCDGLYQLIIRLVGQELFLIPGKDHTAQYVSL